jgi:hypothetical protein
MPTNRFQFSDDFVLNNGNVGINSSSPQEKLDVVGVVKGQDLKVTGVSSFTTYEGFLNSNQNIIENVSISNGSESGSLSGEIIVGTGITVSVSSGTTSSQGYIDSLKVYNTFTVPTGGTVDRPSKSTPGQLFYNKDFKTIEFWDGNVWRQVDYTTQSGRIVFANGFGGTTNIDFINAHSLGNAQNFGTNVTPSLAVYNSGVSNGVRGVYGGGYQNPATYPNNIDYITIQSAGNAIDFGDLTANYAVGASCASSTRGIFVQGTGPGAVNNIDYIQISTLGNAVNFGTTTSFCAISWGFSSPTRGVFGVDGKAGNPSTINYITIASRGNSIEFGNTLTGGTRQAYGASNSIRGIFNTGSGSVLKNTIEYITISTTGNAQNFGDLTQQRFGSSAGATQTRVIFAGGGTPSITNAIDYITITTTGNAQDFGDLTVGRRNFASLSDSHGGLGGF